jgi:hypothetical protein
MCLAKPLQLAINLHVAAGGDGCRPCARASFDGFSLNYLMVGSEGRSFHDPLFIESNSFPLRPRGVTTDTRVTDQCRE